MDATTDQIIAQTRKWITDVVVACNFCPFAAREVKRSSIHYQVETANSTEQCLTTFLQECKRLDEQPDIETVLIIFPQSFQAFDQYLDLVGLAEKLLKKKGYEGIYQVASFHPHYRFAGAPADDPANFTNRSVYPMLHLLREESVDKAVEAFPEAEEIFERNMETLRKLGYDGWKKLGL